MVHSPSHRRGGVISLLDFVYPIGSVYISVSNLDPSTIFGGIWEQIQDRFLLSAGNSYSAGSTGGSASHVHSTGNHTLTIDQIPKHSHTYVDYLWVANVSSNYAAALARSAATARNYGTDSTGGGKAHNHGDTGSKSNMPPYLVVYMWKRIA